MTRGVYHDDGSRRLRRACANVLGFVAVVAIAYIAFAATAEWLAGRFS